MMNKNRTIVLLISRMVKELRCNKVQCTFESGLHLKLVEVFWERVRLPARKFYLKLSFKETEAVYHDYRGEMEAYQVFRRTYEGGEPGTVGAGKPE